MSIFVRPCGKCAAKGRCDRRDKRGRKNCRDCKWRAVTPPKLGRKTLGVFATREEAEAKLQEALVNHRRGIDLLPASLTVSELVERFFKDGASELSVTTLHRYRELWSIHGSALGKHSIADLRKAHIGRLYATLQREPRGKRKPLNPRTVLHLHRVLHRAFEWAVDVDLIGANIFRRVRAPRVKDADTRALSLEEAGKFFDAARGSSFEAFFHVAALTGARRGELVGLKWDAVDLESGALTVRTSLASTRAKKARTCCWGGSRHPQRHKVGKEPASAARSRRGYGSSARQGHPSRKGARGQARGVLRPRLRLFGQARASVQARRAHEGLSRDRRRGRTASRGIAALAAPFIRIMVDRERRRHCGRATLPWALRAEHDAEPVFARRCGRPGEGGRCRQRYSAAGSGEPCGRWEMTAVPTRASCTDCTEIAPRRQVEGSMRRKPA